LIRNVLPAKPPATPTRRCASGSEGRRLSRPHNKNIPISPLGKPPDFSFVYSLEGRGQGAGLFAGRSPVESGRGWLEGEGGVHPRTGAIDHPRQTPAFAVPTAKKNTHDCYIRSALDTGFPLSGLIPEECIPIRRAAFPLAAKTGSGHHLPPQVDAAGRPPLKKTFLPGRFAPRCVKGGAVEGGRLSVAG